MKKNIVRFLAWFGAAVIVYSIYFAIMLNYKGSVPSKTILEVNLESELIEDAPDSAIARYMLSDRPRVRDIVDALDRGAKDDRVVGLVANISAVPMGMAEAQEIRDAVFRFRARKKFAVAYAETFGEFGPGNGAYYMATAFDQIYLQPSGDVGLTGLMIETQFLKGTLDKLGVKFHGDHRYEYKNAFNIYTETKYTDAHKEANTKVMNSWFGQMKSGICDARHLDPNQFDALVDKGPYLGKEALDAKLVDGMAYRDEVYEKVKATAGKDAELLYLDKYLYRAGRPHNSGKTVALIYGVGQVVRGQSDFSPVNGSVTMGSETVAGAFRAAIEDKDVKAILFRVDSPGGSYVASDTIYREVIRARKAGKPVIVSMGNLAGSGGYFVAMAADKIVAQPGTITASIGVLGGKMYAAGFWNKLGLSHDEIHTSQNATMFTTTHDYNDTEWQRFEVWLDRVYVDFTGKVAEGRHLPKERVMEIAKGRIWTGEDAKAIGLVDELGGFDTALQLAKKSINVPESEEVKLTVYPKRKKLYELLLARGDADNSEKEASAQALAEVLKSVQPTAQRLQALGVLEDGNKSGDQGEDVLRMPELGRQR
jgi:protease-4